jgi:protein-S-isoprenylcysteine O-methyltransferase Ste14
MLLIAAAAAMNRFYGSASGFPESIGVAIVAFGLFILIGGLLSLWNSLTIFVVPANRLKTGGIYRFTRNPIYLGALLIAAGWTVQFLSWLCAIGTVGLTTVLHLKVKLEEVELEKKFGTEYDMYRSRTRRWFGWHSTKSLSQNWEGPDK